MAAAGSMSAEKPVVVPETPGAVMTVAAFVKVVRLRAVRRGHQVGEHVLPMVSVLEVPDMRAPRTLAADRWV